MRLTTSPTAAVTVTDVMEKEFEGWNQHSAAGRQTGEELSVIVGTRTETVCCSVYNWFGRHTEKLFYFQLGE